MEPSCKLSPKHFVATKALCYKAKPRITFIWHSYFIQDIHCVREMAPCVFQFLASKARGSFRSFSLGTLRSTFIFYKAFFRAVTTNHQSERETVLTGVLNGGNFPPISPLVHRRKNKGVMSRPRVNEHPQTPSVYRYAHTQTDISASLVCRHGWEMTTIALRICKFSSIFVFLLIAFTSRCSHVKIDRLTS